VAVSELDGSSGHFARARRRVVLCRQKSTPRPFHPCHCQGSPSRILQPYRFVLKESFRLCSYLVPFGHI
jgi:hypothetical protein